MTGTLGEGDVVAERSTGRGGVVPVAVGLAIFGAATYGYLGLAGRALSPETFAPLSVLWTLLNAVGIGLFLPFEQELGRRTAARRAAGEGNRPVVVQGVVAAGLVLGGVAVVCAVGYPLLAAGLFAGRGALVLLLVLAMAGMALSYVVRGLLSGLGLFGRYGAQLAADGALRVAGAAVLFAAGARDPVTYGLVLVAAPVLAVLLTTPRPWSLVRPGPAQARRVAASAMVTLVAASVLSQVLANAGPVLVELVTTPAEQAASGQFTAALVIARVPLFAFAAVQAVLLPGLAGLAGSGRIVELRRRVVQVGLVTLVLGAVGTVAVYAVGAPLVRLLFGDGFTIDPGVIGLIALSGALFMVAQVAAQPLLALGAERWVVLGWGGGLAGLVLAATWQAPVALRASVALVVGCAVAAVVLGGAAAREMQRWDRPAEGGDG